MLYFWEVNNIQPRDYFIGTLENIGTMGNIWNFCFYLLKTNFSNGIF